MTGRLIVFLASVAGFLLPSGALAFSDRFESCIAAEESLAARTEIIDQRLDELYDALEGATGSVREAILDDIRLYERRLHFVTVATVRLDRRSFGARTCEAIEAFIERKISVS